VRTLTFVDPQGERKEHAVSASPPAVIRLTPWRAVRVAAQGFPLRRGRSQDWWSRWSSPRLPLTLQFVAALASSLCIFANEYGYWPNPFRPQPNFTWAEVLFFFVGEAIFLAVAVLMHALWIRILLEISGQDRISAANAARRIVYLAAVAEPVIAPAFFLLVDPWPTLLTPSVRAISIGLLAIAVLWKAGAIVIGVRFAKGGSWLLGVAALAWSLEFVGTLVVVGVAVVVPVIVAAGFALAGVAAYRGRKRYPQGCCENCGYDLKGNVTGVCSECGAPANLEQRRLAGGATRLSHRSRTLR
jgi:hypothetical protein